MKNKTMIFTAFLVALVVGLVAGIFALTGYSGTENAIITSDDDVPSLNLPPEERDPSRLWCTEHSRYEDECYICHPDLRPAATSADGDHDHDHDHGDEGDGHQGHDHGDEDGHEGHDHGDEADAHQGHDHEHGGDGGHSMRDGVLWCSEHDVAENECGICQPQLLADYGLGTGLKVRMADPTSIDQAGVTLGRPSLGGSSVLRSMLGEVSYDRNHLASVTPLGAGVVMDVSVEAGDEVSAGQLLATLNSPAVAEGKSALLRALAEAALAQKTYAREQDLYSREISARKDLDAAQAELATTESEIDYATQRLLNLGLTSEDIEEVRSTRSTSSRLEIRAPFNGTIVERLAVKGTAVEVGSPLFRVADLTTMWMRLSVSETQLTALKVGQTVNAQFDAYPGVTFQGEISWIAPSIDHRTRTFEARVVLPNQHGMLKDGQFGEVMLASGSDLQGVHVPESAIQEVDGRSIVFARLDEDLFETRVVQLGQKQGDQIQVLAGLTATDEIAFDGSYILKSEFLKARLGAGCADH